MGKPDLVDLLVVGGGVNGAGIAADAAGRGLSVVLCEMNDLASATSSNSSKLIHGGLRYLEYYEFRLVKEALAERETLLKNAPHIIWPLRFRLPHRPHLRPAWMIRAGLFLYDHLAKRVTLPASKGLRFNRAGPLMEDITKGFEYSDGWVDDARLVVLNAQQARQHGAEILTRQRCIKAQRRDGLWQVTLQCTNSGVQTEIHAKAVANAAGPWVSSLFGEALGTVAPKQVRLVKGSHIVVPKIHDEPEAYILQNEDGRIVFVIPYEQEFSLVGTTDVEYQGDPSQVAIDQQEIDYLLEVCNQHFKRQVSAEEVVHSYSGVRPLMDDEAADAKAVTRDYSFELQAENGQAPLLSVFGGKITTYRKLSQAAVDQLCKFFPAAGPAWTSAAPLPGGDFANPERLFDQLINRYPWLEEAQLKRYIRSYGTLCEQFLQHCTLLDDLGEHFGSGLYSAEVNYLLDHEWAQDIEDILWRRSKLGLRLNAEQRELLANYIARRSTPINKAQVV